MKQRTRSPERLDQSSGERITIVVADATGGEKSSLAAGEHAGMLWPVASSDIVPRRVSGYLVIPWVAHVLFVLSIATGLGNRGIESIPVTITQALPVNLTRQWVLQTVIGLAILFLVGCLLWTHAQLRGFQWSKRRLYRATLVNGFAKGVAQVSYATLLCCSTLAFLKLLGVWED